MADVEKPKAPPSALLYTILHCTLGDLLIASGALGLSVAIAGRGWPAAARSYVAVAAVAVALGLGYTVYSEWLNVAVRQSWAYSPWMPRVPPLGTGLAPLLQWIVIPALAFWFAGGRRISRAVARSSQLPPGGI